MNEIEMTTKYVGPRNLTGSRIVVKVKGYGQKTFPYDYGASCAHESAAHRAAAHFGIDLSEGIVKEGNHPTTGYHFVIRES